MDEETVESLAKILKDVLPGVLSISAEEETDQMYSGLALEIMEGIEAEGMTLV